MPLGVVARPAGGGERVRVHLPDMSARGGRPPAVGLCCTRPSGIRRGCRAPDGASDCRIETFPTPTGRVALVTKPHGYVVFFNPPHTDDNLCDLSSLFATELPWSRIYNNTVLDGWLEKRRSVERERRLAVMMGTHLRLDLNAWKCCVTTAFNDVYMLQLGSDTLHLIASLIAW